MSERGNGGLWLLAAVLVGGYWYDKAHTNQPAEKPPTYEIPSYQAPVVQPVLTLAPYTKVTFAPFVQATYDLQPFTPAYTPPAYSNNSGSGDLDCIDIQQMVWVGDDDPNGLDADGDGWGCESYG